MEKSLMASVHPGGGQAPVLYDSAADLGYGNPPQLKQPGSDAATFEVVETLTAGSMQDRLAHWMQPTYFTPTGFYLPPGATLTVTVEQIEGNRQPHLLIGTYSRYVSRWNPEAYALKVGTNTITDPEGGIIYIWFTHSQPSCKVWLTLRSGYVAMPYYQLGITTHQDWLEMLRYANTPDVQLVGEHCIITASIDKAREFKDEHQDNVLTLLDKIIQVEFGISGLDGIEPEDQPPALRYLFTETDKPTTYMAATYYRTFYCKGVMGDLLTEKGLLNGWGPWHELGHMMQQWPWTWSWLTETTVNIYSLAVQRALHPGKPLRIDECWPEIRKYLALPDSTRIFNSDNSSIWIRLGLFHQLWLAFGDHFYQRLHKVTRRKNFEMETDSDEMRYFMIQSCTISGYNLSDFFRKWGFAQNVEESAFQEIEMLGLPALPYDLSQVEHRQTSKCQDIPDWDKEIAYPSKGTRVRYLGVIYENFYYINPNSAAPNRNIGWDVTGYCDDRDETIADCQRTPEWSEVRTYTRPGIHVKYENRIYRSEYYLIAGTLPGAGQGWKDILHCGEEKRP